MTEYIVLLNGDEKAWETASAEERAAVFGRHEEFSRLLDERGHTITGGAELTHSRTAKTVRKGSDGSAVVTDGPYAEAAEQLGGYYVVRSDDLDDLLDVCAILADAEGGVEVRAAVEYDES